MAQRPYLALLEWSVIALIGSLVVGARMSNLRTILCYRSFVWSNRRHYIRHWCRRQLHLTVDSRVPRLAGRRC